MSAGWMLVHFHFGFTAPIQRLIRERDPHALDPLAALIVALVLGSGLLLVLPEPFNMDLQLNRAPLSLSLIAGAFLFGIGMQLAGRCSSGTLASAPSGGPGFGLTLLAMVAGVFLGSLLRPGIEALSPKLPPQVLTEVLLPWQAVFVQLLLLMAVLLAAKLWCRDRLIQRKVLGDRMAFGEIKSALMIAAAILLMLVVSGEPWKVLWGLALTGAHAAKSLGWDPATSDFWSLPARSALLHNHWDWIRHDAVVMDLALIYGALSSRSWDQQDKAIVQLKSNHQRSPWNQSNHPLRFLAGGMLMGFGGFLSYGCNISSFLGGIQSFSLHGWVWLISALIGSWFWFKFEKSLGSS